MDRDLHRAHAALDETHWWFLGRRRIVAATLQNHLGERAGSVVVDVGCGSGGMLAMLGTFGRVSAIEGDRTAASTAQERNPDAMVAHGVLPDAIDGLPDAYLVTAFDVIEHLDDDVGVLRSLRSRLDANGKLCVTVPALPWLWSAHDEANGHRRRYTRRSLVAALESAGFQVLHVSYFNSFLLPMVAVARLVERLRGSNGADGTDLDRSLGPLDRILGLVFASERFLVPRVSLPLGVSLIAIARPV